MAATRRLVLAGTAAFAAVALAAVPSASASVGSSLKGFTSSGMVFARTDGSVLAECANVFTGRVISDDGHGAIAASIGSFSIDCQTGTRVTPKALPWTLQLQEDRGYTIEGFDVDVTTAQGTCRYTGPVRGDMQFPDGIYDLTGLLSRESAGCGWPAQVGVSALTEVISNI